MIISCAKI